MNNQQAEDNKKNQYALLDTQVGIFLNPFTAIYHGEAIRIFTTWVNDKEHQTNISKYPHHFSLYYLGQFNEALGKWEQEVSNKELIIGTSVKEESEKQFTIKQLITMLEAEIQERNIVQIGDKA